jgi:hypothetical protein
MGAFSIYVLNELQNADSSPVSIPVKLFWKITNASFVGLVARSGFQAMPQMMSLMPVVRAAAKAFSDFNRDKPPAPTVATPVVLVSNQTLAYGTKVTEPQHVLRLDPTTQTPHPDLIVDEMKVDFISQKEGIVAIIDWPSSAEVDTKLAQWPAQPHQPNAVKITIDGVTCEWQPPVAVLCGLFHLWRGSLKLRFEFVCTSFHTGRVLVAFVPGATLDTQMNFQTAVASSHVIIDLREQQNLVFVVPYMHNNAWTSTTHPEGKPMRELVQGMVYMYVQTPVQLMGSSATPSMVRINVYLSAGSDFEVAVPLASKYGLGFDVARAPTTKNSTHLMPGYRPVFQSSYVKLAQSGAFMTPFHANTAGAIGQYENLLHGVVYVAPAYVTRTFGDEKEVQCKYYLNTGHTPPKRVTAMVRANDTDYATVYLFTSTAQARQYAKSLDVRYLEKKPANDGAYEFYKHPDTGAEHTVTINEQIDWEQDTESLWDDEDFAFLSASPQGDTMAITNDLEPTTNYPSNLGEGFHDLKDICRRFNAYGRVVAMKKNNTAGGPIEASIDIPILYQGVRIDSTKRTQSDIARDSAIRVISSAFRFAKGSLRFKFMFHNIKPGDQVAITHLPNVISKTGFIVQTPAEVTTTTAFDTANATVWHAISINPVVEIEVPYYSKFDRILMQQPDFWQYDNLSQATSLGTLRLFYFSQFDKTKTERFTVDIFYSLADDARFTHFLGFPPVFEKSRFIARPQMFSVGLNLAGSGVDGAKDAIHMAGRSVQTASDATALVANDIHAAIEPTIVKETIRDINTIVHSSKDIPNIAMKSMTEVQKDVSRVADAVDQTNDTIQRVAESIEKQMKTTTDQAQKTAQSHEELCKTITQIIAPDKTKCDCDKEMSVKLDMAIEITKVAIRLLHQWSWTALFREFAFFAESIVRRNFKEVHPVARLANLAAPLGRIMEMFQFRQTAKPESLVGMKEISLFIVAMLAMVNIKASPSTALSSMASKTMISLALYERSISGITAIFASLTDLWGRLITWVKCENDVEGSISKDFDEGVVMAWASDIELCEHLTKDAKVEANTQLARRCLAIAARGNCYQRMMLEKANQIPRIGAMMSLISRSLKLGEIASNWVSVSPVRYEPFVVYLGGEPGVGKSFVLDPIISTVLEEAGVENAVSNIWTRNAGTEYWNNYFAQDAVKYDDFGAVHRQQNSEGAELIALKTSAVFNPPFAAIPDKNRLANPRIVAIASNSLFPHFSDISNHEALWRRRDVLALVRLKPEYVGKQVKEIDSKILNTYSHLDYIVYQDPRKKESPVKEMEYPQFLSHVRTEARNYFFREDRNYHARIQSYLGDATQRIFDARVDQAIQVLHRDIPLDFLTDTIAKPQADNEESERVKKDDQMMTPEDCRQLVSGSGQIQQPTEDEQHKRERDLEINHLMELTKTRIEEELDPGPCIHEQPENIVFLNNGTIMHKTRGQHMKYCPHNVCCYMRHKPREFWTQYLKTHSEAETALLQKGWKAVVDGDLPGELYDAFFPVYAREYVIHAEEVMRKHRADREAIQKARPTFTILDSICTGLSLLAGVWGIVRLVTFATQAIRGHEEEKDLDDPYERDPDYESPCTADEGDDCMCEEVKPQSKDNDRTQQRRKQVKNRKVVGKKRKTWNRTWARPQGAETALQSLVNKISHNTIFVIVALESKVLNLRCLGIGERFVLFPCHYLDAIKMGDACVRWKSMECSWDDVMETVIEFEEGNLGLFQIPTKWNRFQKLTDKMIKDTLPTTSKGWFVRTEFTTSTNDLSGPLVKQLQVREIYSQDVMSDDFPNTIHSNWRIEAGYRYIYGSSGMCGCVLILEEKGVYYLAGMHTAGLVQGIGFAERITQADFEAEIEEIEKDKTKP